jgi:hypothetical protein
MDQFAHAAILVTPRNALLIGLAINVEKLMGYIKAGLPALAAIRPRAGSARAEAAGAAAAVRRAASAARFPWLVAGSCTSLTLLLP